MNSGGGSSEVCGFVFIVGEETQAGLAPTVVLESRLGCQGLSPSSPHRGKATKDRHRTRHNVAKHRHIPGPQVQGQEKERALGPFEGCPRSLKHLHWGMA